MTMTITRALTAAFTVLAHITLLSASSVSAYYNYGNYYSNPCNKEQCCWALNVNHWDTRNLCYGCEGQNVCPRKPTPRPTKKPTKKPTISWRNDGWNSGWNNDGYGSDKWGSGARQNFCCQTTGNCPIDTPVAIRRQWLDRANRIRLTYCCQRSISSWQGDSWRGGGHGRSLQNLLPLCVNTDMPTMSPTLSPSLAPSVSKEPSSAPSSAPSETPSSEPSSEPSSVPSSEPSLEPSKSLQPSSEPSEQPSVSLQPSLSSEPSSMPSDESTST
jgi:hypothetical protein